MSPPERPWLGPDSDKLHPELVACPSRQAGEHRPSGGRTVTAASRVSMPGSRPGLRTVARFSAGAEPTRKPPRSWTVGGFGYRAHRFPPSRQLAEGGSRRYAEWHWRSVRPCLAAGLDAAPVDRRL